MTFAKLLYCIFCQQNYYVFIMWYLETAIIAIAWMLAILSAILGLDRMIRIIMGNYLINSIILWLSNFIELISQRLLFGNSNAAERLAKVESSLGKLLLDGRPTILLTTYFLLLLFIIKRAHIGLWEIRNEGTRALLTILFIPSTVLSILLSVATAIFGAKILSLEAIEGFAKLVDHNEWLYHFILLTPLRIVLPALFVIVLAAFMWRNTDEIVQKVVITDRAIYDDDPIYEW